jgi:protein-S-isoprenylcysteine O-methyltransferase Ste14
MITVAVLGVVERGTFEPFPFHLALAVSLLVLSAVVGIAGVISLGKNRTANPEPKRDGHLVQNGIYGLVRHPLYLALILWAGSWSLFGRSWPAAAATLALTLFLDSKARHEERLLRSRFPEYRAYQSRVRRFIPGLY